jgi:4-hydroxy-tetrahydrodipicolinate reductase
MTKIVIAGAAGRMGQALIRCAMSMPDVELVGATEQAGNAWIGRDAGTIIGADKATGVVVSDALEPALTQADVLIDFTYHTAVPQNAKLAASLKRAVVIGTTGLSPEESQMVDQAADQVPLVWAPNMSLGVNLLFAMAARAAAVLGDGYEVRIDETHHVHKVDAPSGTALRLGESVADGAGKRFDDVYLHDEGGKMDSYPSGKIAICSYREGEVLGDHTVAFDGAAERIELTHQIKSRDALALGALHAAKWVCSQRPRRYDMQDVLGLRNV